MAANFKTFVEILSEKADNWQNYCICIACRYVNGRPNALLQKFPFKTERVRNYLKKCQHFKNKYPEIFFELFASETERMEINEFDENIAAIIHQLVHLILSLGPRLLLIEVSENIR
ncbi:hypothetical protein RhiirA5_387009 [Rhizophagus irregularis]|uniref:Uncharacterized protein n=1 Tax=Rhizophagus irregularis TaxID=588596 RepID=A0A2N0NH03_9GLOM|nr:hypothetical protein RhiirA5_387009 [Rhizophagus irregularis]